MESFFEFKEKRKVKQVMWQDLALDMKILIISMVVLMVLSFLGVLLG